MSWRCSAVSWCLRHQGLPWYYALSVISWSYDRGHPGTGSEFGNTMKYIVRQIGANKGAPRVYLEMSGLAETGLTPGASYRRETDQKTKRVSLIVDPEGTHKVSKKVKNEVEVPVIDINSAAALQPFEGMEAVRIILGNGAIHILPLASEVNRARRIARVLKNAAEGKVTTASISHGGGILDHAAHAGLAQAGLQAHMLVANEIDESLVEHAQKVNEVWNKDTIALVAPMQEVIQDGWMMNQIPEVDIFAGGIPCSGASRAGKSKKGLSMMEDHEGVGHLIAPALALINRINPAICVIENVPEWSDTASAKILQHMLRDMGYDFHSTLLKAQDFGCLENRIRWFGIGVTKGIEFDVEALKPQLFVQQTLADVLDPIGPDAADWRTFDYLKTKEVRDASKGNSFSMQTFGPEDTKVGTLRKGYAKSGSTDPLLRHPTNPDLLRQFTVAEHARIKQVPPHLVEGLSKTEGHIILGQGVAYKPVSELFRHIGEAIRRFVSNPAQIHNSTLGYSLKVAVG